MCEHSKDADDVHPMPLPRCHPQLQWRLHTQSLDKDAGIKFNNTRFDGNQATSGGAVHYPCVSDTCPSLWLASGMIFDNNTAVGGDGDVLWAVQVRAIRTDYGEESM